MDLKPSEGRLGWRKAAEPIRFLFGMTFIVVYRDHVGFSISSLVVGGASRLSSCARARPLWQRSKLPKEVPYMITLHKMPKRNLIGSAAFLHRSLPLLVLNSAQRWMGKTVYYILALHLWIGYTFNFGVYRLVKGEIRMNSHFRVYP